MEVPSQTSNKKRKRGPSVHARITFHTPSKSFERLFQEHSLDDIKRVVCRKLGLADGLDVQLTQIRGNSSIVLEDDDDFEAFRVALETNPLVEVRVIVVPRDGASRPTPISPRPPIPSILPEMLPPTKKRERKSARLQEALVPTTEPKSGATTISTNKEAHTELDNAVAPGQMPVPLPSSVLTPTEHQQPKVSKLKLKSKGKVHLTSSSNGPRLTQRVQELHKEGETNPIRSTEGQKLKERNPETLRAATGKRMILNPSVSPELQPGRLLSPPSIIKSYRSEITVQSPGEGSSSPPSPAHGDNYGENDAAGLLLELSAKNIATSLVPLSPAPIPTRPFAEIDETGSEGAKVESEISEGDERQVVPSVGSQARRKSSESYWSKSSSDPSSTKGKPSPNSRSTTLPTPPIVQSASSIRPQPKNAFPQLSSPPAAVDLSLKVLESPVIEKHKFLIQHDISIEQGDVNQPRDEELKPTRILHHVADTSTPPPLLRKLRPSQSLPRLSVISRKFPRTVVPLMLPKSTSLYTPTMPNPNLDDSEDVMSSDDDSSDTDDQNSTQIPANQQAASRPVRRQQRNVLATF